MISVKFYTFSKRENSTKQPPSTGGTEISCNLKDGCDFLAPVIEISCNGNPTGFNYAYISDFGRYYFVSNWTYYRGLWAATLTVDVLASWKTEIGASTQYVSRAASDSDGTITDTFYPTKNVVSSSTVFIDPGFATKFTEGCFIVAVIGGREDSIGGVSYYAMPPDNFANMCKYLLSDDFISGLDIGDAAEDLAKAQLDPFKYITSAIWIPVNLATAAMAFRTIKCGWWTLPAKDSSQNNITGVVIDADDRGVYTMLIEDVTVPRHPLAASRGVYMNGAPFSKYTLYMGPFGNMALDATLLADLSGYVTPNTLQIRIEIDLITGLGYMGCGNGRETLASVEGNVGVPVAVSSLGVMAQTIQSVSGYVGQGLGVLGSKIGLSSRITEAVQNVFATIGDVASMREATPTKTGSTGSLVSYKEPFMLEAVFYGAVDDSPDHYGKPLCKNKVINTLSGYVQTGSADIAIPSTAEENAQIVSFMNGGFFYE